MPFLRKTKQLFSIHKTSEFLDYLLNFTFVVVIHVLGVAVGVLLYLIIQFFEPLCPLGHHFFGSFEKTFFQQNLHFRFYLRDWRLYTFTP